MAIWGDTGNLPGSQELHLVCMYIYIILKQTSPAPTFVVTPLLAEPHLLLQGKGVTMSCVLIL